MKARVLLRTFVLFVLAGGGFLGLVAWKLSDEVLHPPRPRLSEEPRAITPASAGLPYEDVELRGSRGWDMRGWWIPPPPGSDGRAVLFTHGNGEDRRQGLDHAPALRELGFGLLFDFSGRGDSDGDFVSLGWFEREDVLAAVDWIAARPDTDEGAVYAWGRSMGAVAVLRAMPEEPRLRGAVLDSPFSDFESLAADYLRGSGLPRMPFYPLGRLVVTLRAGFDPADIRAIESAPRIRVPVLLFVRDRDTLVPPAHSDRLWEALPPELRQRERVTEKGHNEALPAEVQEEGIRFLAELASARAASR